jgi:serine/threonine protein kinase
MNVSATKQDPVLAELVEELTNQLHAGEAVDLDTLAARHPEQAGAVRELFPALEMLAHLSGSGSSGAEMNTLVAQDRNPEIGTLGDFRIVREVGRGGMGVVYEAVQISMGRRVALKVLPFAAVMDPRHLQRFKNEARAAGSLQHPHIVPVHFVGSERGVHYFAMQFIEGQTLAALIQQLRQSAVPDEKTTAYSPSDGNGKPDAATEPAARQSTLAASVSPNGRDYFRKVAEWGEQAAGALEYAHQTGIVHRDVKPGNLMIDAHGHLWVTDFGLAHVQQGEASLTMTGDLVGTLRYMSPEQALAKRVLIDHRTDVYSLGVTMYELLTLEPAFAGTDRQEVLRQIAFEEPESPRRHNRAVPAELETVVLKALEKNPQDRYATAKELANDLRRFLEDKPIRARRPSLAQRAAKWGRRHRPLVWSAAVALVAILTAVAGSLGYVVRDRAARLTATEQKAGAALAAARTAIEAGDLALAGQRVAEAQGYLGAERDSLPDSGSDIDRVRQDIDARQGDARRLQEFRKLASDAQDKMSSNRSKVGERVAQDALGLYGVLATGDWLSRLDRSTLSTDQKRQVRETAYVTLVSLADFKVRWLPTSGDPRSIERSLELLRRAEAFHRPTRAFYFVRGECHRRQGNTAATAEDVKRYKAVTGQSAWDYYLPGHSWAWAGDLDEAIRSYRKALAVQPDHYNSMYFLALRLSAKKGILRSHRAVHRLHCPAARRYVGIHLPRRVS